MWPACRSWTIRKRRCCCRPIAIALFALQHAGGFRYALVFKNVGPEAGASLEHSHSQIVATPMVPSEVQREMAAAHELYRPSPATASSVA